MKILRKLKKLLSIMLTLGIMMQLFSGGVLQAKEYDISSTLESSLKSVLAVEQLTDDLFEIETLDLRGMGITNLSGIERFTNLKELVLDHNAISDVSPLQSLERLETLSIKDQLIEGQYTVSNNQYLLTNTGSLSNVGV